MQLPFRARVAYHRVRRHIDWRLHPRPWANGKADAAAFTVVVAARESPLQRAPDGAIAAYTEEKVHNLRLAAARVDGCVLQPGEVLSFCRTVGPTTRRRGYLPALELLQGRLCAEVGGGLCQLSNLLFLLALDANVEIVERHRHSYDLFRGTGRTVPFGCGATVFYNYVDFQFANRLAFPILLRAWVEPPSLRAEIRAARSLPFRVAVTETDHRFFWRDGEVWRANRVWREVAPEDGSAPTRELLFTNECRVLYPADDLVEDGG